MTEAQLRDWEHFKKNYFDFPETGLAIDLSRMKMPDSFWLEIESRLQSAYKEMELLEAGAIANPDEQRMVGHYWLRNPKIAPTPEIRLAIESTISSIETFAAKVHSGAVQGAGGCFTELLLVGIGGSALGPQFVSHALSNPKADKLRIHFFDNTDPDGMCRILDLIGSNLTRTMCVVISKSGGTKETRNGMIEAQAAFARAGLDFAKHSVAITREGSDLDNLAIKQGWLARFPMWDWVGGRTSQLSAVGLLPAAIQGFRILELMAGAAACDAKTRTKSTRENPAALLSAAWFFATKGKGEKNMVILPYKDRLELLAKYLQQLIMESLGKRFDRNGVEVMQGITVLGNKGATDQHSYIQQLRDGLDDFFATFVSVRSDGTASGIEVEPLTTTGDYLSGFLQGTRAALMEGGRQSLTLSMKKVDAFTVGSIISLFERAVGFYATLINVNAYHQPGVESGKVAASRIIKLQSQVLEKLAEFPNRKFDVLTLADQLDYQGSLDDLFMICEHLAADTARQILKEENGTASRYGRALA